MAEEIERLIDLAPIPATNDVLMLGSTDQGVLGQLSSGLYLNTADQVIVNSQEEFDKKLIDKGNGLAYHLSGAFSYMFGFQPVLAYPVVFEGALQDNTAFIGNRANTRLTYTGTGALFRIDDAGRGLTIRDFLISGDFTNSFSDINALSTSQAVFRFERSTVQFMDMGIIEDALVVQWSSMFMVGMTSGIEFKNIGFGVEILTSSTLYGAQLGLPPIGGAIYTFTGIIGSADILSGQSTPSNGDSVFDIPLATIVANFFSANNLHVSTALGGNGFVPLSQDQTTPGITFAQCGDIPNSTTAAVATLTLPILSPATIIMPAIGATVIVTATTWETQNSERITVASDGSALHTGLSTRTLSLDRDLSVSPSLTPSRVIAAMEGYIPPAEFEVTFSNGTNFINRISHGLNNGDRITFFSTAGTLPSELRADISYHVVNSLADTFQVAYTNGGGAIVFTDDGTPANSYKLLSDSSSSTPSATILTGVPQTLSTKSEEAFEPGGITVAMVQIDGTPLATFLYMADI